VNVKNLAQDESLEIDMDLAVCEIKGTNVTCGSRLGENRIQVLRGAVSVRIRATGAAHPLKAGEEMIVRPNGQLQKLAIDVQKESDGWRDELSSLGETFDLNELPGLLRDMKKRHDDGFKELSTRHASLKSQVSRPDAEVQDFRKAAERYLGSLQEDAFQLRTFSTRLNAVIRGNARSPANPLMSLVVEINAGLQRYAAEVNRFLRDLAARDADPDTEPLWQEISRIWSDVEEFAGGRPLPIGQPQDVFKGVVVRLTRAQEQLSDCQDRLGEILTRKPASRAGKWIQTRLRTYLAAIERAIRAYAVVEIPAEAQRELSQMDEELRHILDGLREAIERYNPSARSSQARFLNSVSITGQFARARRVYANATRLYQSIMRSVKTIVTAEQQVFQETWDRIRNNYQDLGVVSQQIQDRLDHLEDQLEGREH